MYAKIKTFTIGKLQLLFKDKRYVVLLALFLSHLFLRFYEIETKSIFLYDQVDSAWAAKHIIVDHRFPLIGPENKVNSGFFIGPLYYYLISVFYYFTNLDPIAAGLFAGFTSIIGFFTLFIVTKKLFSFNIALIAVFINTVSYAAIDFDRVQWEPNFIPIVGLLTFYFLYKILLGNEKNILYLSIVLALSFHVHLTPAVFLPIIASITLPFFPKTKKTLLYTIYSIPILLLGLSPVIAVNIMNQNIYAANQLQYVDSSFHGIHLTRILQLFTAAFTQIESYTQFPAISRFLSIVTIPFFFIFYFLIHPSRKSFIMVSLVFLFFAIPLLVLSTYRHIITDYYFSINRFVGLIMLSYLAYRILELKKTIITLFLIAFTIYYTTITMQKFFSKSIVGLRNYRILVKGEIQEGRIIQYEQGNPLSYIYYVYTRKK